MEFLRGLFVNVCILVTLSSLGASLIKGPFERTDRRWRWLVVSVVPVVIGVTLMQFPVIWHDGVIIDLRLVPVFFAAALGGPVSGVTTTLGLAVYRYQLGGPGTLSGVLGLFVAGATASLLFARSSGLPQPFGVLWRAAVTYDMGALSILILPGTGVRLFTLTAFPLLVAELASTWVIASFMKHRVKAAQREHEAKVMAETDHLTGLYNVRSMHQMLSTHEHGGCLLVLDIDHFKNVNDTYGHLFGDLVLKQCAHVMREAVRSQDWVFRSGGEEFVVLLRDCPLDAGAAIADRLRQTMAGMPMQGDGKRIFVTISGGLVRLETGDDVPGRISAADQLMYQAKAEGRNRICAERPLLY
ncbi:MAG TPA: diguanylate cyclase [Symbiobacteriaceae bacterium]